MLFFFLSSFLLKKTAWFLNMSSLSIFILFLVDILTFLLLLEMFGCAKLAYLLSSCFLIFFISVSFLLFFSVLGLFGGLFSLLLFFLSLSIFVELSRLLLLLLSLLFSGFSAGSSILILSFFIDERIFKLGFFFIKSLLLFSFKDGFFSIELHSFKLSFFSIDSLLLPTFSKKLKSFAWNETFFKFLFDFLEFMFLLVSISWTSFFSSLRLNEELRLLLSFSFFSEDFFWVLGFVIFFEFFLKISFSSFNFSLSLSSILLILFFW